MLLPHTVETNRKTMIKTGSDFSGVGAFDQALSRLGIEQDKQFACDMDKYARQTYCLNFGTDEDIELSKLPMASNLQIALAKSIPDLSKILRQSVNPKDFSFYYPENVYDREIPSDSLDIYMTSPPCQSFSLAGKRKGENSKNGVLFYNSHEFIRKNNPRYFIFENVKGLLSDDNGKTFQRWIDYLGGKSVNGNPVIFPHDEATPYHVYYQVMNAKHYGVPQNRERIFIIGIRDDADNEFSFPKPFHLVKRLKDVLETEVDEKYFLSDSQLQSIINSKHEHSSRVYEVEGCSPTIMAKSGGGHEPYINEVRIGAIRGRNVSSEKIEQQLEINESGLCNSLTTVQKDNVVVIPANNSKGYDIAEEEEEEEEDSINFSNPNSETRRGRVGHGVAQTLDTACNQGVLVRAKEEYTGIAVHPLSKKLEFTGFKDGNSPTLLATDYKAPKCIQFNTQRIRRLTPTECFRLMDFNENFKWNVSDSQAYKQAGNSIVVACLVAIISKFKL